MASIRIKGLDNFHTAVTGVKKAAHIMRAELQQRLTRFHLGNSRNYEAE